jgi:hypothetical protein
LSSTNQDINKRENEIRAKARECGLNVSSDRGIVTVEGRFTPNDTAAYRKMEADASTVLSMFRQTRPGSVWGTDSGSVGGHVGLTKGYVLLHKSGVEMRLANRFR